MRAYINYSKRSWLLILGIFQIWITQGQNNGSAVFDGKTLAGWQLLGPSKTFSVVDGSIAGVRPSGSQSSFLVTEKQFSDFVLEMDIRLDDSTAAAGIEIRTASDQAPAKGPRLAGGLQVSLDPTARGWSGSLRDQTSGRWLYPACLNQLAQQSGFRLGEFNHLKIECIGREIKTWVNQTPVAYLVDASPNRGHVAISLEGGGSAAGTPCIFIKNIRISSTGLTSTPFPKGVYVVNTIPNSLCAYEIQDNWKLLFDGRSSKGWIGAYKQSFPSVGWQIKDGLITVLGSQGKEAANGGDVVTVEQFSAFDLSFEFRLTPGANSGVKYFVTLTENNTGSAIGLEYQLLDDSLHPDAKLGRNGDRTLASLYDLIPANRPQAFMRPIGHWNRGRIIVYPNNHVEHYLNGVKVLEYERGSEAFRALVAISKYKIWKNFGEAPKGHILLQDHGNEVSFRSIKIRQL